MKQLCRAKLNLLEILIYFLNILVVSCEEIMEYRFVRKYSGMFFSDGILSDVKVRSLSECGDECGKFQSCHSFLFHRSQRRCLLADHCPDLKCDVASNETDWMTYCKGEHGMQNNDLHVRDKALLKDCKELNQIGNSCTGVYNIQTENGTIKSVICDMQTLGGGWTVIQNRHDGSVDFYRGWIDYKNGFGSPGTEYWLGNEAIYHLTSIYPSTSLYIEMEDWNGAIKYSLHADFRLDSEANFYALHIANYSGTSGDCLDYYDSSPGGSLDRYTHNGMKFTTFDLDNDGHTSVNCAQALKGGWWYSECMASNLNGLYMTTGVVDAKAISCKTFGGDYRSLKRVKMMIRGNS